MQNSAKPVKSLERLVQNGEEKINKSEYYKQMRLLAQAKRKQYNIQTNKITIPIIQKIYKEEGIKIDRRNNLSAKIKAVYFCHDSDCSVLLNNKLPREPKIFALVHELKHHYVDQEIIESGEIRCGDYNANKVIEVAAEVFAAEFIFPEGEFLALVQSLGITQENCNEETIVKLKNDLPVAVSYKFILKRLEWFRIIEKDQYSKTKFTKLEEEIYGKPFYKQEWYKQYRKRKQSLK